MEHLSQDELIAYLNEQTGKITWEELQPYFAKGAIQLLDQGYDLIDVAAALIRDDKPFVLPLIEANHLGKITDDVAKTYSMDQGFWALVVAPWVVIQPIAD